MFLSRLLRGYKESDAGVKHQKSLPIIVYEYMWENKSTNLSTAIGQLTNGALFYGMRSCEYSKVKGKRKTKLLLIKNFTFYLNKKKITITRSRAHLLRMATSVVVEFIDQKNGDKYDKVTMHKSNRKLGPVKAWAETIIRILSYPDTTLDTPINTVRIGKKNIQITSAQILVHIRSTVAMIGVKTLGFTSDEVGNHSIRSSFAMLLYLAKVPTTTIMILGRWLSDSFLLYIRKQVLEFSAGLSTLMLQRDFYTLPEVEEVVQDPRSEFNSWESLILPDGEAVV